VTILVEIELGISSQKEIKLFCLAVELKVVLWSDGNGVMWHGGEKNCYIEGLKVVEQQGEK
jgi:hypothetical protein